jgi:MFS family permease
LCSSFYFLAVSPRSQTSVFAGPALGPLVTGFIATRAGFRWNLYLQAIMAGGALLLLACVPETHNPTILRRRALAHASDEVRAAVPPLPSLKGRLVTAMTLPFKMALTEPIIIAVSAYMACVPARARRSR